MSHPECSDTLSGQSGSSRGFGRRLLLFVVVCLCLLWGSGWYGFTYWRSERLYKAEVDSANLAIAMAEFVQRTVQATDLVMQGQASAIARLGQSAGHGGDISRMLTGGVGDFSQAITLAFFDAQGRPVAASEKSRHRLDVLGMEPDVRQHMEQPDLGLFVGPPRMGGASDSRYFSLSRRVTGPRGEFLGVIIGAIDAAYLADYFQRYVPGDSGTINLAYTRSSLIVARVPDFAGTFASDISKSEVFERLLDAAPVGTEHYRSAVDGLERGFSYRRLGNLPLVLVVGIADEDVLLEIRSTLAGFWALLLVMTVLLLVAAGLMLRNWRSLQTVMESSRQLIELAPLSISTYDAETGRCLTVNPAFCKMVGASTALALQQRFRELASWRASGMLDAAERVLAGSEAERVVTHLRTSFGKELWLEAVFSSFQTSEGKRLLLMMDDRTQDKQAETKLQLAQKIIASSSEAILITDESNRIISVNAAFERITGYAEADVLGRNPRLLSSGRHSADFYQAMWEQLLAQGHWEGELWDRRRNGEIYPKWTRLDVLRDQESGRLTNYVAVFSDITKRKQDEARIRHLAHHDSLTGLPNRLALTAHLDQALARADRQGLKVALMFIDLDRFKTINDSLGHTVGDQLLVAVAGRLRQSVLRASDMVARLGGDEFVVVLEDIRQGEDALPVAQKILDALGESYRLGEQTLFCTPSIGIGLYPEDAGNVDALMQHADTAMYHAKSAGRNTVQFFTSNMNAQAEGRLALETDLRSALRGEQFLLHYQPQYDLLTGQLTGMEALIRWQHPQRGMVSPGEFIPLAEETGLVVGIGEWVLAEVCRQASEWHRAGRQFGAIAVNIAAQHFRHRDFITHVRKILAETAINPAWIELEITESGVMSLAKEAVAILNDLKGMGLGLAIDDFGTGYSSLAYLKRFPVDKLKIDRSFVMDIERDPSDAAIAASVIALAHSISLKVVAEGVETPGQASFLRQHGCDRVQGFLYARPQATPALEAQWERVVQVSM